MKERTFSVSDEEEDDEDEGVDGRLEKPESGGGMDYMQELTRGMRDHRINYTDEQTAHHDDDEDDDADLVEEVYMEEHDGDDDGFEDETEDLQKQQHVQSPSSDNAISAMVEDYYADEDPTFSPSDLSASTDVIVVTDEGKENGEKTTTQIATSGENVEELSASATKTQQQDPSSSNAEVGDEAPIVLTNPDIKAESDTTNPRSVSSPSSSVDTNDTKDNNSSSS